MKGFLQDRSRYLSPEPRICVANASGAIAQLTGSKSAASDVALSPSIDNGNYDYRDDMGSNTILTNFQDSTNFSQNNMPSRSASMATRNHQELDLENLKKIDLNYLTLFRRSARFSNKGFNHFFLCQELKCDNYSIPIFEPSNETNIDQNNNNINNINGNNINNNLDNQNLSISYTRNISSTTVNSTNNSSHAIYNMSFSHDGKYLASAGADGLIRVWEVITSEMERHINHTSPNPNNGQFLNVPVKPHRKSFIESAIDDTINDLSSMINRSASADRNRAHSNSRRNTLDSNETAHTNDSNPHSYQHSNGPEFAPVFKSKPIKTFYHDKTVNSLDWSKNNFLLSSSEDGTAKLWHVDRADCLQTYKFDSIVTCAKFHKSDDRFFVACQWNGRVVFLSILEKEVIYEVNLNKSITCFDFSPDSTRLFIGCDKGYIVSIKIEKGLIIETDHQIKRKHNMPRITSISTFVEDSIEYSNSNSGTTNNRFNHLSHIKTSNNDSNNNKFNHPDTIKMLVSCNDSKIRLFNFTEKFLEVRYSGHTSKNSIIAATVNENHTHVISGSDDGWTYMWQLYSDKKNKIENEKKLMTKAHFDLLNYFKDDTCLIDNKYYGSFHTHNNRCNVAIFAPRASLKLLELSNDPIFDIKHQYYNILNESNVKDLEIDDLSTAIILSTDNTGKIKVFRRDFSRYIRKAIQSKKGSQILERKQSVLSRNLSKKVMNRNSLVIPNYDATTHNITDTMSSVYMDSDSTLRGRGNKGFVRPANKFAVESSLPKLQNKNESQSVPKITIEKQSSEWSRNNHSHLITSTPDTSHVNGIQNKSAINDHNNSTLQDISEISRHGNSTEIAEGNNNSNILNTNANSLPLLNTSTNDSSSCSYSTENSIQVSNTIKNIDDEIKQALLETPNIGVVHEIGQKQHSQSSSVIEKPEKIKGDVYINEAKHKIEHGGVKKSQVVTIPLDTGDRINRNAEGWSTTDEGKYTCSNCQGVNFTPRPMGYGKTNEIKFYCDDCKQEAKNLNR